MSHKKAQETQKAQTPTRCIASRFLACFICLIISVNSVAATGRTLLHESTIRRDLTAFAVLRE